MSTFQLSGPMVISLTLGDAEAAEGAHWRQAANPATRQLMNMAPPGPLLLDMLNPGAAGDVVLTQTDDAATAAAVASGLPPVAAILETHLAIGAAGSLRQAVNPVRRFVVIKPPAGVTGRVETLGIVQRGPSSLRLPAVIEVGDPPPMDMTRDLAPAGLDGSGKPIYPVYATYTLTTPAGLLVAFPTLARIEYRDTFEAWEYGAVNVTRSTAGLLASGFAGTLRWDELPSDHGFTIKRFGGYNSVTAHVDATLYDATGSVITTFRKDFNEGGV